MTIREAVNQFLEFHEVNSKPATARCYTCLLRGFQETFGEKIVEEITSAEVYAFLIPRTEGLNQATKSEQEWCALGSRIENDFEAPESCYDTEVSRQNIWSRSPTLDG